MAKYPELQLLIGGKWISRDGAPVGGTFPVHRTFLTEQKSQVPHPVRIGFWLERLPWTAPRF